MSGDDVQLAWALVAGQLAHISEFDGLPRGSRPKAMCALCGLELTMKLGPQRAHHYAHRSVGICALQNPETARHYNTKQLLASKLRLADDLSVVTKCRHAHCFSDLTSQAAEGWDEVRVEPLVHPVRPDILLLKSGTATLAIEVRATHAVPDTKVEQLAELGLPWVEVTAGSDCDRWQPGGPLPALRHESRLAPRFCSDHSEPASTRPVETVALKAPRKSEWATQEELVSHGERWQFRVVDCYSDKGERVRRVFWIFCKRVDSRTLQLRLAEDRDSWAIAEVTAATRSVECLKELNSRLEQYLRRSFARFDSPRRWQVAGEFPENPATIYGTNFMPVKYRRGWVTPR